MLIHVNSVFELPILTRKKVKGWFLMLSVRGQATQTLFWAHLELIFF